MITVVPGVVDIDRIRRVVISHADDGMSIEVKHYRSAGIDLRLELGKGKTSGYDVIRFLVIAISYRISPGFVKKLSAVCPVLIGRYSIIPPYHYR